MNASSSHCYSSSAPKVIATGSCLITFLLTFAGSAAAATLGSSLNGTHGAASLGAIIVALMTSLATLAVLGVSRGETPHRVGAETAAVRVHPPVNSEAMMAGGPLLRDHCFAPRGKPESHSTIFSPSGKVNRTNLAVALVNALGLQADAQALAGKDVTARFNGRNVVVSDQSAIPEMLRGYVQIALDKGILNASFSFRQDPDEAEPHLVAKVNPTAPVTWSFFAFAIDHYRQASAASN